MNTILKAFGPRVAGAVLGVASGWVFAKTRGVVSLNPDQIVETIGIVVGGYQAHRGISMVVNPTDAAKPKQ